MNTTKSNDLMLESIINLLRNHVGNLAQAAPATAPEMPPVEHSGAYKELASRYNSAMHYADALEEQLQESRRQTAAATEDTDHALKELAAEQAERATLQANWDAKQADYIRKLAAAEKLNGKLSHSLSTAPEGAVIKLKEQLAACHENQAAYRAETANLRSQLSELNGALLTTRQELAEARTEKYGADVGPVDVRKLLAEMRKLSAENAKLRAAAAPVLLPVDDSARYDSSVQIGHINGKDAS